MRNPAAVVPHVLDRRSPGDPSSELFPDPGEVRDSILLSYADGLPAVFHARAVEVRPTGFALHRRQRLRHGCALIVTDCRTAVASSAPDSASMLLGHVRHGWLLGVDGSRASVLLTFAHPGGARMSMRVALGDAAAARREIRARAWRGRAGDLGTGSSR